MRILTSLIALLVATGLSAEAIGPAPQKWIQLKGAFLKPDGCNCLKDAVGIGAGAGQWFTSRWGTEVDFLDATLKSRHGVARADEKHLLGSALFNLNPEGTQWFPYLRAGIGVARIGAPYSLEPDAATRFAYHGGIGVQRFFSTHGLGSLEARSVTLDTRIRRTEYQGLLGLGYRWGAPLAAVVPVPAPAPEPEVVVVAPPVPQPPPVVAPPAPAPVPPPPPAVPVQVQAPPPAKIILDEALLHFANAQAVLPPDAVEAIRGVAASLKGYAGTYDLVVTGHTSSLGGKAYNKALSLRRAKAVAAVLIAEGIPADKVSTVGMGPDQPIAENKTKAGQARNRRVEIDVKAAGVEVKRTETEVFDPAMPVKKKVVKP
jgi:outer membrane protein OmpA-like peptidoglycan-associated protein